MGKFVALIGDLIDSRKMADRKLVQEKMKRDLAEMNAQFRDLIVSNFTLTLGDEFQAILRVSAQLWECLDRLENQLSVPYRIGLGWGEISTEINPEMSIGADGEAFWKARAAIEAVHAQNWNGKCNLLFRGGDPEQEELMNTLIMAGETLKASWTELQRDTFAAILEAGIYRSEFSQKDLAHSMGITESSLSKRLTAGNIKAYLKIRECLGNLLEKYHEDA